MAELKASFFALLKRGFGVRAAARELGIKESTALNWSSQARRPDAERPRVEQVEDAAAARIEALMKRQRQLEHDLAYARSRAKAAEAEELTAERVRADIFGLVETADPEPPAWVTDPRERRGSGPGVPVVQWSDWHLQEVVRLAETGGRNEFSTEIARARVKRLVETTCYLCFEHMVNPHYPGIVVDLGGDFITGEIHPELAETNDRTTPEGILLAYELLLPALIQLANRFGNVFVVGVAGNHARDTLKPRSKRYVARNFDWLLYCLLERALQDDPRFRFLIPESTDAMFRVYGHRFLSTHGDCTGVRGGDGIIGAVGPIIRGKIKVHTSEAQIGRDFDTMLLHHWHQTMHLPSQGIMVNGSLKGYDEFARTRLRARYEPPQQNLFFVHPRRGITCHWPVVLADQRQEAANEWISWRD